MHDGTQPFKTGPNCAITHLLNTMSESLLSLMLAMRTIPFGSFSLHFLQVERAEGASSMMKLAGMIDRSFVILIHTKGQNVKWSQ